MVCHANRAGWDTRVISFDGWRPRASLGETGGGLDEGGIYRLSSPAGLDGAHAHGLAMKPRIIHVHDPLLWEFSASLARESDSFTVATFHVLHRAMNKERGLDGETMSSKSERMVAEQADRLHVTTPWVSKELARWGEDIELRVRLASLGIDDTEEARRSRTVSKEGPILYVGRFSDVKGTDTFIEALEKAGSELGPIEVAGGLPHNLKREARWKKRFELAAPGRVQFRGWLQSGELGRLYADASVLVVPSRVETFGQVALEGLLHGVPVLASSCAAFDDWLRPHDAAEFFDVGDPADLARKLVALRQRTDERDRLGKKGPGAALSAFSWSTTYPALDAIYREL